MYSCSLDRSAKAWDACSGRLLLSVACPAFLRAVTTDPAEVFLFAAGGGGVIFQVPARACVFVVEVCYNSVRVFSLVNVCVVALFCAGVSAVRSSSSETDCHRRTASC